MKISITIVYILLISSSTIAADNTAFSTDFNNQPVLSEHEQSEFLQHQSVQLSILQNKSSALQQGLETVLALNNQAVQTSDKAVRQLKRSIHRQQRALQKIKQSQQAITEAGENYLLVANYINQLNNTNCRLERQLADNQPTDSRNFYVSDNQYMQRLAHQQTEQELLKAAPTQRLRSLLQYQIDRRDSLIDSLNDGVNSNQILLSSSLKSTP